MKIAVTFERRADNHQFVREYEPETIQEAVRWLKKYDATCDVESMHMDEDMRIAVQSEQEAIAKANAEVCEALRDVWSLMVEMLPKVLVTQ